MSIWHVCILRLRWLFVVPLFLLALVATQGCSNVPEQSPRYGGILTYNRDFPRHGLDPWYVNVLSDREVAEQVFEGLLQPDTATFEPVPCLAEEWWVKDAGKTYVFRLRKGVRFHDNVCFPNGVGREVSIEDVRYSFERNLRGPKTSWGARELCLLEGARDYLLGKTKHVAGIKLFPPDTIVFHLRVPARHFRYVFYSPAGYIIPREAVSYYGSLFGRNPVGTGPFRLALWNRDRLLLARNDHYWATDGDGRPLPYIAGIEIRSTNIDLPTWMNGELAPDIWMEVNNLDFLRYLRPSLPVEGIAVDSAQMAEAAFLVVNFGRKGPLQRSKQLRRSFFYALDVSAVHNWRVGHLSLSSLLPKYFCSEDSLNGKASGEIGGRSDRQGEAVTVKIRIQNFPMEVLRFGDGKAVFTERKLRDFRYVFVWDKHEADVWFVSYQWLFPDPEELLRLFCSDFSPWGYKNTEYDSLFAQFLVEDQQEIRSRLARRLVEILDRDVVYQPLFEELNYYAWRRHVHRIRSSINPFSYHFFKYVWLGKH